MLLYKINFKKGGILLKNSIQMMNAVIISVISMLLLCFLEINIILSILISAIVGGVIAGIPINNIMKILIKGMGDNSETALSYILLGAFAVAINQTGIPRLLSNKISLFIKGKRYLLLLLIAFISCFSQNLIPVHIAFIPILIPSLLGIMNKLKIDRRAAACALTFGLEAPYITLPIGFGLIFHGILKDQITSNGLKIELSDIWKSVWPLGIAMIIGLFISIFISYRKPRYYTDTKTIFENNEDKFQKKHWLTLLATIIAFFIQIYTGSLPLGAITALGIMLATRVINKNDIDDMMNKGIGMMGVIAFIMLVSAGYANVIRKTGGIEKLVNGIVNIINGNKEIGVIIMLIVGLFVTMGIGTSFGTVPILATIYVPLALKLGLSSKGIIILIACAGALGDAGSPASDTTLGPTSGLNADGKHNHIKDTCIPTFLHYNIPLLIMGAIGAILL